VASFQHLALKSAEVGLVFGWNFLHVVDDHVIYWDLLFHQLGAELVLDGGENVPEVPVRDVVGVIVAGKDQVEVVRAP